MKTHRTLLLGTACLLFAGTAPAAARAEPPLTDPTRPFGLVQTTPVPAHAVAVAEATPVWPRLQSVQVAAQGGSSALVDGRLVRVGERLGELTVVAIDAQGILLRGARYDQRLGLVPGIATTVSARAPPALPPVAAAKATP